MANKFRLGNRLRDKVSGVEGITTGYVTFLNGCVQWNIHPKVGEDGKVSEANYYDEQQLEFVDDGIAAAPAGIPSSTPSSSTGGANSVVRGIL